MARKRAEGKHTGRQPRRVITDAELSDLLLRACHDLKAPVRTIRTHSELILRDGVRGPDFAQRLGFLMDSSKRLDALVDALASYALALRIEATSFQPAAMDVLLRTVLAKLAGVLRANDAIVTHGKLPRVQGNPDRLIELLQHLIANALQHRGEEPPRIHVTAVKQAESWLFAIGDNGAGVEAAYLESIFRPFEHGSHQQAGAGMGLAISRAIVERHGGRIWAESKPDNGTTVFFTLPAD